MHATYFFPGFVALGLIGAIGCTSASRSGYPASETDAGAIAEDDASTPSPPVAPPSSFAEAGAGQPEKCEREIDIGQLSISNPACFVNEHVSNRSTKLAFPCAGGDAKATFDGHLFEGTVTGDVVKLTNVEPFVFNNCDWISTETIEGDLAKKVVTYSYSEKPKVSCPDMPCTANGTLEVAAGEVVVVK